MQPVHGPLQVARDCLGQRREGGIDRRIECVALRLGGLGQHVVGHRCAGARVADAKAQSGKAGVVAKRGDDRAQAVVSAMPAPAFEARSACWQIEFVVRDQNACRRYLVEAGQGGNGLSM
jgi:hypothetical protein